MDADEIQRFTAKVREAGCGLDAEIRFLMAINHALKIFKLTKVQDTDHHQQSRIRVLQNRLYGWRIALGKKRIEIAAQNLEVNSLRAQSDLSKVDDLVNCEELWEDYDSAVQDVIKGKHPSDRTLQHMSTALAALLVFKNMHRPGIVTNATLFECKNASIQDKCRVVRVKKHKTSRKGPAKMIIAKEDVNRYHDYLNSLRPLVDPTEAIAELFVLPGPIPLGSNESP